MPLVTNLDLVGELLYVFFYKEYVHYFRKWNNFNGYYWRHVKYVHTTKLKARYF